MSCEEESIYTVKISADLVCWTASNHHAHSLTSLSLTLSNTSSVVSLHLWMFKSPFAHRQTKRPWINPGTVSNPAGQDLCISVRLALELASNYEGTLDVV